MHIFKLSFSEALCANEKAEPPKTNCNFYRTTAITNYPLPHHLTSLLHSFFPFPFRENFPKANKNNHSELADFKTKATLSLLMNQLFSYQKKGKKLKLTQKSNLLRIPLSSPPQPYIFHANLCSYPPPFSKKGWKSGGRGVGKRDG